VVALTKRGVILGLKVFIIPVLALALVASIPFLVFMASLDALDGQDWL